MKTKKQIVDEAKAILALKQREIGKDKNDGNFYKHHLKRLEKIEHNKESIGIENYNSGNELLPKLVKIIAKKKTQNSSLQNITESKFNLSDLTKMHSLGISQSDINKMNSRYKLKNQVDMEDLIALPTQELNAFKELVMQYREDTISDLKQHSKIKRFIHSLNKVIEKHNLDHKSAQTIEPIEILIDLDKNKVHSNSIKGILKKSTNILPPILTTQEEAKSIGVTPSSSASTILPKYSASSSKDSLKSDITEELYPPTIISPTPTPPKVSKPSRVSFRAGR